MLLEQVAVFRGIFVMAPVSYTHLDVYKRQPSAITPGNPLERLAENARSAVAALDNIVWAVNPQHDTVGSLADYLCDYAPSYLQAADIECTLDIHVDAPHHPLGLTVRHGLLMSVKEALQNVVKHAGATSVRLGFREEQGKVEVSIVDNGRGLAEKPASVIDHNGLDNMRRRLDELGGRCEIGPDDDGRGTVSYTHLDVYKRQLVCHRPHW